MREARIILPVADNAGNPLDLIHRRLARALCQTFGGATVAETRGMWVSSSGKLYDEPGRAYDVAMADTPENAAMLRAIAMTAGASAGQEAVYVRFASGEVNIIDIPAADAAAAANAA